MRVVASVPGQFLANPECERRGCLWENPRAGAWGSPVHRSPSGFASYSTNRLTVSEMFWPPKPKLLLSTWLTRLSRAVFGM